MQSNHNEIKVSAVEAKKMLKTHAQLTHSENVKINSHVQREQGEWILNTLMIEGVDVPFKYKRKKLYKSLKGQRVNITYYSETEIVAGFEIEVMNIVRIRVS